MTRIVYAKHGEEILVDDWNYDWLNQYHWYISRSGYAYTHVRAKALLMHRLIKACPKGFWIDHISHVKLDNQENNLRMCSPTENHANQILNTRNKSGYKGVRWDRECAGWEARIKNNGKTIHLGWYNTAEEAAIVYDHKARELWGEFALCNFSERVEYIPERKRRLPFNSTGFSGVLRKGKRFMARGIFSGIRHSLGCFDTAEEAAKVYDEHMILIGHPELANTNLRKVGYQND